MDIEASGNENDYGLFASHGALLVANSETDLEVHDIENGWNWAKIPGTTTITEYGKSRHKGLKNRKGEILQRKSTGWKSYVRRNDGLENGLFGMNLLQPDYGLESSDWRERIDFRFKKSVFSFENLLVCLESDIRA